MAEFGNPSLVNPFDRFGDHLRIALKAPASYQLLTWLESGPGAPLPDRGSPPRSGRWVVCGYGRLGRELTRDLRAEGLEVTVIDPNPADPDEEGVLVGDGSDPWVMAQADLDRAVGFVAGTDNDTTNLSLAAAARRSNPRLFVCARQNRAASAPLFAAMHLDALLVPSEVIAHEIYAQLSTPLLWRFLREMPARGNDWAQTLIDRINGLCGTQLQAMWKLKLTREEAPALVPWLHDGGVRLGDLLRNPENRDEPVHAVVLVVVRDSEAILAPDDEFELRAGDELLLVGWPAARRALSTVLVVDAAREYVLSGRRVPTSWVWRKLTSAEETEGERAGRT
jgi:Trk K+ transport system NAD-binding subunit